MVSVFSTGAGGTLAMRQHPQPALICRFTHDGQPHAAVCLLASSGGNEARITEIRIARVDTPPAGASNPQQPSHVPVVALRPPPSSANRVLAQRTTAPTVASAAPADASAPAQEGGQAERRRRLMNLIGADDQPWTRLNVRGVNWNGEAWRVRLRHREREGECSGYFPIKDYGNNKHAAWVAAVMQAESFHDEVQPNRFGQGAWKPPLTLKGISVAPSVSTAWKVAYTPPGEQNIYATLTFNPADDTNKEARWNDAREALAQMQAGTYERQPRGVTREFRRRR
jgi:hypothetical protein